MNNPGQLSRHPWYQHLVALHNVLALCLWLSVEPFMVIFLLRHAEGNLLTSKWLHKVDCELLWISVRRLFRCSLIVHSLVSVYSIIEGERRGKNLLFYVEGVIRNITVYFVAIPVMQHQLPLRSLLIVLNSWTLLNVFSCLKSLYNHKQVDSAFVDWWLKKLFLLLYPVVSFVEVNLVRKSAHFLKEVPLARAFPSSMPNVYNFQFDIYQIYYLLPFFMVPYSAFYYFYKLQNKKLKYL